MIDKRGRGGRGKGEKIKTGKGKKEEGIEER
jgi:hypothetical protein